VPPYRASRLSGDGARARFNRTIVGDHDQWVFRARSFTRHPTPPEAATRLHRPYWNSCSVSTDKSDCCSRATPRTRDRAAAGMPVPYSRAVTFPSTRGNERHMALAPLTRLTHDVPVFRPEQSPTFPVCVHQVRSRPYTSADLPVRGDGLLARGSTRFCWTPPVANDARLAAAEFSWGPT
jgi:hypothetical protein